MHRGSSGKTYVALESCHLLTLLHLLLCLILLPLLSLLCFSPILLSSLLLLLPPPFLQSHGCPRCCWVMCGHEKHINPDLVAILVYDILSGRIDLLVTQHLFSLLIAVLLVPNLLQAFVAC